MFNVMKQLYTVFIEQEAGGWHAYSPSVPGCFAGASTRSLALRRFRSALKMHLEALVAGGKRKPVERRPPVVQIAV